MQCINQLLEALGLLRYGDTAPPYTTVWQPNPALAPPPPGRFLVIHTFPIDFLIEKTRIQL